ncbi:transcriptional regulator, CarD family [Planococcus glaciei]|uniref:CarD family transcriptional regulator n=1 Tax=Planococcus glaciei TaxID=459472 RepID=UPI0008821619|nr:CarD family transcriptional regulator [Planococcus glaciei]SDH48694.1 transcriptional regulator, CarD family [Planococcus glaciei]
MFKIGDLIIYSAHGICKIDDISEKTVSGITKKYYKLHPMENSQRVTISTPVNNDKVVMLGMLHKDQAMQLLENFNEPGLEWIDNPNARQAFFFDLLNTGDRREIAKVVNTLMRKKIEVKKLNKNLYERDHKVLNTAQAILFKELAISLETTFEEINALAAKLINDNL